MGEECQARHQTRVGNTQLIYIAEELALDHGEGHGQGEAEQGSE